MPAAGYEIHKQQLFHWIGRNIQKENGRKKVLRDDLATKALDYIAASLDNGLWVKTPEQPETFRAGTQTFTLRTPITCFTEWSLGDSLPHTYNYGRIGFGFPKKWVIERGGQSVTYFRHAETGNFLKGIFRLLKAAGICMDSTSGDWTAKPNCNLADLVYLLHFAKMVRALAVRPISAQKAAVKAKRKFKRAAEIASAKTTAPRAPNFQRRFGKELQYVEEREWRIVYHPTNSCFKLGPSGPAAGYPSYFLPYIPGDELFTLVVPDNKVMSRLLASTYHTKRLFTPHLVYKALGGKVVPPVTVLAHSDLGTF